MLIKINLKKSIKVRIYFWKKINSNKLVVALAIFFKIKFHKIMKIKNKLSIKTWFLRLKKDRFRIMEQIIIIKTKKFKIFSQI
jgi:acyl-CoA thioesterase FadM